MLGEQIGEFRGKRTGRRVLSVEGGFKGEASVEDAGTLLGIAAKQIVTGCGTTRPDGSLYGESRALVLGSDGSSATWKGLGVANFWRAARSVLGVQCVSARLPQSGRG